jgi:hypothetical protein
MTIIRRTTIVALASLLLVRTAYAALPSVITYNGYLLNNNGNPVTSSSTLGFNFYSAPSGGTPLNGSAISVTLIPSADGYFSAVIDTGAYATLFDTGPIYMGIAVGSEVEMSPRIQVTSAPFALSARSVAWSGVSGFPDSTCSPGQAVTAIGTNGVGTCDAAGIAVTASAPLSATGTSTVNIAMPQATASAPGYLSSGDWLAFASKVSSVQGIPNGGIAVGGSAASPVLGLVPCPSGQVLKAGAVAGQWACDADAVGTGTVTAVDGGPGLTGGPITTSGTLSVAFAGSGAATTVSRSDHVHSGADITSGTLSSARLAGSYAGITGLGALTSLSVSGSASVGGDLTLGPSSLSAAAASARIRLGYIRAVWTGAAYSCAVITGVVGATCNRTGVGAYTITMPAGWTFLTAFITPQASAGVGANVQGLGSNFFTYQTFATSTGGPTDATALILVLGTY